MKILSALITVFLLIQTAKAQKQNLFEDHTDKPKIVTTTNCNEPPSDAVALFENGNLDSWQYAEGATVKWETDFNSFTATPGEQDIYTNESFGNCQLHVEWKVPADETHDNLNWGNSGVYLMGLYEVQIYDSHDYQHEIYYNGQAGSIYKQHSPLVNASKPADEWQSFDIVFTAPVFNTDKTLKSPAFLTVFHNGILVQNHVELIGPTTHENYTEYKFHADKLPLMLQSHGSKVSYRNIWIREF